jgi:tetratricopeptide (TPR) repeat protein
MILSAAAIMVIVLSHSVVRSQPIMHPSIHLSWQCDSASATCLVHKVTCDRGLWHSCYQKCTKLDIWGDIIGLACRSDCNKAAGCEAEAKADRDRPIDDEIASLSESIRLDPKKARNYFSRAVSYMNKGDYDRAIADYSEAIRLEPKAYLYYDFRGEAYVKKGDYDRAIADYDEVLRLYPTNTAIYWDRGRAWEGKHDLQKALADFKRWLELEPNDPGGQEAVERVTKALRAR